MLKNFLHYDWQNPKRLLKEISDCISLIETTLNCLKSNVYTKVGIDQFKKDLRLANHDLNVAQTALSINIWRRIYRTFQDPMKKLDEWQTTLKGARLQWITEHLIFDGYIQDPVLVPTQVEHLEYSMPDINPLAAIMVTSQLTTFAVVRLMQLNEASAKSHQDFLAKSLGHPDLKTLAKETSIQVEEALEAANKNHKQEIM